MNYFVLSGHSRLPNEAVARAQSDTLSISVHVDRAHGVILQADATQYYYYGP